MSTTLSWRSGIAGTGFWSPPLQTARVSRQGNAIIDFQLFWEVCMIAEHSLYQAGVQESSRGCLRIAFSWHCGKGAALQMEDVEMTFHARCLNCPFVHRTEFKIIMLYCQHAKYWHRDKGGDKTLEAHLLYTVIFQKAGRPATLHQKFENDKRTTTLIWKNFGHLKVTCRVSFEEHALSLCERKIPRDILCQSCQN